MCRTIRWSLAVTSERNAPVSPRYTMVSWPRGTVLWFRRLGFSMHSCRLFPVISSYISVYGIRYSWSLIYVKACFSDGSLEMLKSSFVIAFVASNCSRFCCIVCIVSLHNTEFSRHFFIILPTGARVWLSFNRAKKNGKIDTFVAESTFSMYGSAYLRAVSGCSTFSCCDRVATPSTIQLAHKTPATFYIALSWFRGIR